MTLGLIGAILGVEDGDVLYGAVDGGCCEACCCGIGDRRGPPVVFDLLTLPGAEGDLLGKRVDVVLSNPLVLDPEDGGGGGAR